MKEQGLVVVVGPPGIGKTTVTRLAAKMLAEKTRRIIPHLIIDELRHFAVLPSSIEPYGEHEEKLWRDSLTGVLKAIELSEVPAVFVDGLWYDRKSIRPTLSSMGNHWNVTIVHLHASQKLCLSRNRERHGEARLSDREVRRLWLLQAPTGAKTIEVLGKDSIQHVAHLLLEAAAIIL